MNNSDIKEIADKILHSICDDREELLSLGKQLNLIAITNKDQADLDDTTYHALIGTVATTPKATAKRIAGVELIFNAKDQFLLNQVNRLPWSKEQKNRFFRAYYAEDNRKACGKHFKS